MSAIGSALARAIAALGGPQTAVIVVVAGVVVGGVGGAAIAVSQRSSTGGTTEASVSIYPCPNQGPAITTASSGQQLLVTGRLADDSWVRIHLPEPGRTEGWVETGPLTITGSIDSLPVATCAPEAAVPAPAVLPVPSLTAVVNATPSPAPTPVPTPSPTANTPPTLAGLAASPKTISYDQGSYCPSAAHSTVISVKAGDAAGITGVALWWKVPGAAAFTSTPMTMSSGSATSGTWQATLDTVANSITKAGTLAFYAIATDIGGATAKLPAKGSTGLTVAVCANRGPSITGSSSNAGTMYWNPLGVVGVACPTATSITANVSDIDGVKSVTLFYRKPGSSSYASKAMTANGQTYSAGLDTGADGITIPTPPTGSLAWYIKAVDNKNVAAQTKASTITIRRCDSPARFFVNALGKTQYPFGTNNTFNLVWSTSITDPDNLTQETVSFTITNNASGVSASGTFTVSVTGQRMTLTSGPLNGPDFVGSDTVTWTITTHDQYGGTSTSSSKGTVMVG